MLNFVYMYIVMTLHVHCHDITCALV